MKFCWKFDKTIEEQIFCKVYKIWEKTCRKETNYEIAENYW